MIRVKQKFDNTSKGAIDDPADPTGSYCSNYRKGQILPAM
jgi:hypothetical protein